MFKFQISDKRKTQPEPASTVEKRSLRKILQYDKAQLEGARKEENRTEKNANQQVNWCLKSSISFKIQK